MANTVAQQLGEMVPGSAGSVTPGNFQPQRSTTTGAKTVPTGPGGRLPTAPRGLPPRPPVTAPKGMGPKPPRPPQPPSPPRFSANNPPLGTAPGAMPHPGLRPPYPDARSPQPMLGPTGVPVQPTPRPPVGSVPPVMPPTMPPLAQTPAPTIMGSLQMPHIPPGLAPMPQHPQQAPQGPRISTRRPGMSGLIGNA